jgi:DNA-binding GntR family transcriptional regulator
MSTVQEKGTLGTKRDQIVDHLRRRIVGGELARGERLRQDDLAEQFGASITPVREAFTILESEGLVTSEPHRGVRVAMVDLQRATSLYVLRRLSEPYAVERATLRLTELDLRSADRLAHDIESAAHAGEIDAVRKLNHDFHFTFYDRCGIAGLTDHIAALWGAFPWDLAISAPERSSASAREHRDLLGALRVRDAKRAGEITAHHICQGFLAITASLGGDASVDPFEPGAGSDG